MRTLIVSAVFLLLASFSVDVFGAITLGVTPASDSCLPGSVRTVYSNVQGDTGTSVTWTADGGALDVSNEGYAIWTAPGTTGIYTVMARSVADPAKTASTRFTVVQPKIKVSIIPAHITLYKSQPIVLQSILWGSTNSNVTWSKSGGTLKGTGREVVFYSDVAGTYTVAATSDADPTATFANTIVVTNNPYPPATANGTEPVDCTPVGTGTTYDITSESNFDAVPWATLRGGDTVRIHNQGTPYHKQILLSTSGTANQPIRICGVSDNAGNLPEINGANSTAKSGSNFGAAPYSIQKLGGIVVYNPGAPYYGDSNTHPHDIAIEGLKISGFNSGNTFTDSITGTLSAFDSAAAAIRVQRGGNIIIRGNEIMNCGNGLFAASNDGVEAHTTRNLLVQGNNIHANSNVNRYTEHQCYLQVFGLVVQGNYFGPVLPGALGGQLKTRSVQQFLRYNYLEAASRIFDLVEVQDSQPLVFPWLGLDSGEVLYTSPNDVIANYDSYQTKYVYGNIVNNTGKSAAIWLLHGAADTLSQDFNSGGPLHFYYNTVYTDVGWGQGIVDFGPYQYAATARTTWPTAHLQNNVFIINALVAPPYFYWNRYMADRVVLGKNWVSSNWGNGNPAGGAGTGISSKQVAAANVWQAGQLSTQVSGISKLITATLAPVDFNTFLPKTGSAVLNASLPLTGLAATLPPMMQYSSTTHLMSIRQDLKDIGAVSGTGVKPASGLTGSWK